MQNHIAVAAETIDRNPSFGSYGRSRVVHEVVIKLFRREWRALDNKLNLKQVIILLVCEASTERRLTNGVLARYLRMDKPTVTRAVDHLERLDLLVRTSDPKDRRVTLLSVTEAGRGFADKFHG